MNDWEERRQSTDNYCLRFQDLALESFVVTVKRGPKKKSHLGQSARLRAIDPYDAPIPARR
jgi:hypothetical protein